MTVKYLTYDLLKQINESSVKADRNRNVFLNQLPISRLHMFPVVTSFLHNDIEIRTQILLNNKGQTAWLDMAITEFNALPEYTEE